MKRKNIPKYYQITRDIIAKIRNGNLATGQQAPSENQIIKKYKVSNTTARKALYEIEKAGWVKRIKGKGTYVCHNSVNRSINRILGFSRNMLEEGMVPSTKLIDVRIQRSGHSVTIRGRRYTLKGPLCRIQRVRFADGVAMMEETRYISTKFCPGIEKKNLESSLYEIYEKQYDLQLVEVHQTLSAVMIDADTKEFFDIPKPVPGFRVEGVTFCGKEMILEMEDSIYRGDKYRFSVLAKP